MKDPIEQYMQRPIRYWFSDGLNELAFGLIFIILGIYFYLNAVIHEGSPLYNILDSFFVFVILGLALLINKLIKWLKERFVYPRTGYVKYRETHRNRWVSIALGFFFAVGVMLLVFTYPKTKALMPTITSVICGFALFWYGYQTNIIRFYLLSLTSILIGFSLSVIGIGNYLGLGLYCLIFAAVLCLSSGLTFWNYLRNTQAPMEPEDEQ